MVRLEGRSKKLWKSVEIFCALFSGLDRDTAAVDAVIAAFEAHVRVVRLRACSGCAGDYEDPDRRAWTSGVVEDHGEQPAPADDFPAPRE
jgi:hypothetical protein